MTTEKMSVHKALAEVKLLDTRILTDISGGTFCVANKHNNSKIKGVSVDDYRGIMQGYYDKASDHIKRRQAIKRAIMLSNAVTKVTIQGKEYTVAEAIEMNRSGIQFDEILLQELKKQYNKAQTEINRQNESLDDRAEKYVIGLYGTKEKTNTDDFEKTKKDFINSQMYELVDPINILDKINQLEEKINAFKAEVDSALSVSNAITEIEVTY